MEDGKDLRVVVTGGTGALGLAVCRAFLEAGARVAAVERRPSERLAKELSGFGDRAVAVVGDLSSAEAARRAMEEAAARLGGLRVLCSAAGAFEMGPFATFTDEQLERMMTANFRSAYHAAQAALPHLVASRHGKILFVGARPALTAGPQMVAYAASKAAVLSMTRSLAVELLHQNIQVNAVLPSTIDTPANRAAMPEADPSRWPKPEQIAAVMRWLCSKEADIVSGAELPVYGRA
jgi:NAD(P)-dependent dehydrogenase (short-subunit alcohol dehydrogenase family)